MPGPLGRGDVELNSDPYEKSVLYNSMKDAQDIRAANYSLNNPTIDNSFIGKEDPDKEYVIPTYIGEKTRPRRHSGDFGNDDGVKEVVHGNKQGGTIYVKGALIATAFTLAAATVIYTALTTRKHTAGASRKSKKSSRRNRK